MKIKSQERNIYEKFFDLFKEIYNKGDEDDEDEIEQVIFITNKDIHFLEFEDDEDN